MFGTAFKVAGILEGACAGLSAASADAPTIDILHRSIHLTHTLHQTSMLILSQSVVCDMMFKLEDSILEHLVRAESDDLVLSFLATESRCYPRRVTTTASQRHVHFASSQSE